MFYRLSLCPKGLNCSVFGTNNDHFSLTRSIFCSETFTGWRKTRRLILERKTSRLWKQPYIIKCYIHHQMLYTSSNAIYITKCYIHHQILYTSSNAICIIRCYIHHQMLYTSSNAIYIIKCYIHHQMLYTSSNIADKKLMICLVSCLSHVNWKTIFWWQDKANAYLFLVQ